MNKSLKIFYYVNLYEILYLSFFIIKVSKMAIDKVNLNFQKLGKSMKNYAMGNIIIYIVTIIVALFSGFSMAAITMGSNPAQALNQIIETFKFIALFSGAISIIIYFLYGNFLKEISNISKNNNQYSEIFHKIFLFLLIGLISQIIIDIISIIISYQNLTELQHMIPSIISMNEAEINQLINQMGTSILIVKLIKLIPFSLFICGYFTFRKFGNQLKLSNLENPNSIKIDSGINLLLWGAIISAIGGLLDLIPNAPLVGLISFVSLIFIIVGLFKAGNGFLLYSTTAQLYKSPEMHSSQYSTQNFASQGQTGYSAQNPLQKLSGEERLNTDFYGKSCHICGANQVDQNAKYCSNCGAPLE